MNLPTNNGNAIPQEVLDWMMGKSPVAPAALSNMMSDISNKMSWYIAWILVQRMSKFNGLLDYMNGLEDQLFGTRQGDVKNMSETDLRRDYNLLSKSLNDLLEFSRKFSAQAKDLISDPERDALVSLIRSLDQTGIKSLKQSIEDIIKKNSGVSSLTPEEKK